MRNPDLETKLSTLKELHSTATGQGHALERDAQAAALEAQRLERMAADLERRGELAPEFSAKVERMREAADELFEAAKKARADAAAMGAEIVALEAEIAAFGGTTSKTVEAKRAECDELAAEIARLEELAAQVAAGATEANQARLDDLLAKRPAILAEIIAGTGERDDSDLAALDAEIEEARKSVLAEQKSAADRADTMAGLAAKADGLRTALEEHRAELDRLTEDYRLGVALEAARKYLKALDAAAAARIDLLGLKDLWPVGPLREVWLPELQRPTGFKAFHDLPANVFTTQPSAVDEAKVKLAKSFE